MEPESSPFFINILILLGTSTILLTLFYRLKLVPLLAFIVVGAIFGPTGLGLVEDPEELEAIAELGLAFLLFLLGLEFSLPRLIALRRIVFQLGGLQFAICTLAFFITLYLWGLPWQASFIVAGGLALSSTAIVSRELSALEQLNTRHGEIAIGILLFQDLVAVALLIAVPILAGQADSMSFNEVAASIVQSIGLLILFFLAARYLLPRILIEVAHHKSAELLALTALVIVLLSGTLTAMIGLSMELGAFIAGMMLGDTRFRHQLEVDIRPFRDLLLGLFFIAIGMLVDLDLLSVYWFRIVAYGILLVVFKATIITIIARLMGESWRAAMPAGLALSQGGEFLFALMALATRNDLVPEDVASFMISLTIVSMVLTPLIIRYGALWVDSTLLRISRRGLIDRSQLPEITARPRDNHVVILGFGRVGQTIARFLRRLNIDYVVLEVDDVRINEATAAGEPVYYGDSTRLDILRAAGIEDASIVIISFDDTRAALKILRHIREINPQIPVLTRTRDDSSLQELLTMGSTEVIPETHEASLTLVSHALLMLQVPSQKIHRMIDEARRNRYKMLRGFYHGERAGSLKRRDQKAVIVHAVRLTGNAWACGRRIGDLNLPLNLGISELHRGDRVLTEEDELDDIILERGDVVILNGYLDEINAGESYLLRG